MTVDLSLPILALALSAVMSQGHDNYRPRKKDLSWGVKANGLRMAVWTNPANDKIFATIRNFSTKKICYCDSEINFSELGFLGKVYARKHVNSPWHELKLKPMTPEEIKERTKIIVAICPVRLLKPNEEISPSVLRNKKYSIFLDLRGYSFPSDWSGTVEAKIFQSVVYGDCNKDYKVRELVSPTFEIELPFTEAAGLR